MFVGPRRSACALNMGLVVRAAKFFFFFFFNCVTGLRKVGRSRKPPLLPFSQHDHVLRVSSVGGTKIVCYYNIYEYVTPQSIGRASSWILGRATSTRSERDGGSSERCRAVIIMISRELCLR